MPVEEAPLRPGDLLTIGAFEIRLEEEETRRARGRLRGAPTRTLDGHRSPSLGNATIVRPLADFAAAYGARQERGRAEPPPSWTTRGPGLRPTGCSASSPAWRACSSRADSVDDVLARVLDLAFEAFPVDRGFILLSRRHGRAGLRAGADQGPVAAPPRGRGAGVAHHARRR